MSHYEIFNPFVYLIFTSWSFMHLYSYLLVVGVAGRFLPFGRWCSWAVQTGECC